MTSIKIREDIFQSLINNGSAVITFKGGVAENYTINEMEGGVPYREFVISESVNENDLTAKVIIVSCKIALNDNKAMEVLIDDAIAWNATEIRDNEANNLIK